MLKLDRKELMALYQAHVEGMVDEVEQMKALLSEGDGEKIRGRWRRLVGRRLAPTRPFVGLSWDVLDFHVPRTVRRGWALQELPVL